MKTDAGADDDDDDISIVNRHSDQLACSGVCVCVCCNQMSPSDLCSPFVVVLLCVCVCVVTGKWPF